MTLVSTALEQSPETRERYLRSACGPDSDLYSEVADRVSWEVRMGDFLCQTLVESFEYFDRPFEPGETVAGRFRVLSEVGRGGMGVVYEAYDEKLDRRVALKSALRGHDNRLPPETRAAREVSHYNVCKVHELHTTRTEMGEVEFLTMEYIDGETLSARIRRAGPLPPEQAREIARQVCAGLTQAHRQGVIHGDLKCGNIILTEEPEGALRAVITDFGLAAMHRGAAETGLRNQLRGSFDYMAPELFSGATPAAASDLYALGVILHVMLTGKLPAPVSEPHLASDASTLTLGSLAIRPTARRCEKLSEPWRGVVERCLKPAPDDRFSSAEEVMERLDARERNHTRIAAAVAAAVVIGAGALWLGHEPAGPAVRLAVLPITVEGPAVPAAAGLAVDLADRLSGARRGFVVIPPAEAERNRVDTPDKAKTVLSATHVLRAHVRNTGAQMVVQASVIDAASGQSVQRLQGTYPLNDISLLSNALTATITGAFRLRSGVPMDVLAAAAYPSYLQGLYFLRRDNVSADQAIPYLQNSVQLDPRSALPYAALAEAQLQKFTRNYGPEWLDRAAQSVAKAQSFNADSPAVLLAAGLLQQQHGLYDEAARDFNRAGELAPDNADAWRRLAEVYGDLNRPDDAIATYQRAIRAQPDYYAPYLEFGLFYYYRAQFQEAERLFRNTIAVAPGLARGYMDLGLALKEQGRYKEAEESLVASLRLLETSSALTNLGALYYQQERYQEAATFFEKSLKSEADAIAYEDLGDAYRHLGSLDAAAQAYRTAESMAEAEVIQNPRDPFARALLARLAAQLEERRQAEFEIQQALVMNPGITRVLRTAALTFEALAEREQTLKVLSGAPWRLLDELSHQPDMRGLQQDPRFQELLRNKVTQQ